ncbi:MAG: hypothetical protein QM784_36720 [Polyangiaceae bacterium]
MITSEVVLDDHDRVAGVDQLLQHFEQAMDVREVQARRRLVEQVQRAAGLTLAELAAELDALRLAATERRRGLADLHVAEADFIERRPDAGQGRVRQKSVRQSSMLVFRPARCSAL